MKSTRPSPVQFRPGSALSAKLAALARKWKLPRNEVARRLALLSANELLFADYEALDDACRYLGNSDAFEQLCEHLSGALQSPYAVLQETTAPDLSTAEGRRRLVVYVLYRYCGRPDWEAVTQEQTNKDEAEKKRIRVWLYQEGN